MEKHILIDQVITAIEITKDKMALLFRTTEGDIKAICDADCCSHTWVENISLPVNGLPATVQDVADVPILGVGTRELKIYGCKIVTDKGDIMIEYRNESNGYYGGDLMWPDETGEYPMFYGGVRAQNIAVEDWVAVTSDI